VSSIKWHTPILMGSEALKIKHHMRLMTVGSCFSDHIKKKLSLGKFSVHTNPFGILYNPVSIAATIKRLLLIKEIQQDELFFHEGLYRHPDMHSSVGGTDIEQVVTDINRVIHDFSALLVSSDVIIITTGTAYVHIDRDSRQIVGNNHKLPASHFERRMLTSDEVVEALGESIQLLRKLNPQVHIVFTVSPVRHIKDGLVNNAHSKAILLDAAHRLRQQFVNSSYFPSYEIMMDDLREYRFYEQDLIHPNQIAIDYIWEKFKEVYLAPAEIKMIDEFSSIREAMQHRLLHPDSLETKHFRAQQYQKVQKFKSDFPALNWEEELAFFQD
jgi:GSCFA family